MLRLTKRSPEDERRIYSLKGVSKEVEDGQARKILDTYL